ncbi:LOW QUALITY PROTEIN: olfactory receptor 7D2-like [Rhynchonycteris naso]
MIWPLSYCSIFISHSTIRFLAPNRSFVKVQVNGERGSPEPKGNEEQKRIQVLARLGRTLSRARDYNLILHGFSSSIFLSMYLVTMLGNLLIILAISSDFHLHTPMYFFLSNLSFIDISFSTTIVPNMLVNIQTEDKAISYMNGLTQVYFFMFFPFDVTICQCLHYNIMNPCLCGLLVFITWFIAVMTFLPHISLMIHLSFCRDIKIPHFFCELTQILKLACSDTSLNSILIYFMTGMLGVFPFWGILFSYSRITLFIRKMSSSEGKQKTFSTCGSHLTVVSLFYVIGIGVYFTLSVTHSSQKVSVASMMYTVVNPMLTPFIYSLKNKNVKKFLGRLLRRAASCL